MLRLFLLRCCITSSFISAVHAFSVTIGEPTQCDDLPVSWTGGQAPFQIIVTPFSPNQAFHNISVPASAFNNGKGSYSIPQFPFKNGTQFLLTMSDAMAFGSGGTSTILTVGPPVANNNCNDTVLSPDFFFSTPLVLQQCNNYEFNAYGGAVLPATITGLIPGGENIIISNNVTTSSYTWVTNVASGTSLIFFMTDSQGRQGGVSPLNTVQPLTNTSCLNLNSPSSTASAPSQTSHSSTGSNTATVGIIAGSVVGGVILLVLLIIFGIWWIRKSSHQSQRKDVNADLAFPSKYQTNYGSYLPLMQYESLSHTTSPSSDGFMQHSPQTSNLDNFSGDSSISSSARPFGSQTVSSKHPIMLAPPVHSGARSSLTNASTGSSAFDGRSSSLPAQPPSRLSSNVDGTIRYESALDGQVAMVAGQTPLSPPAQVIVHTDLEDIPAPLQVIELPPQYTERRPLGSRPAPRNNRKPPRS